MPHIHEKYDYTVTVFIVHKEKVLLVNHPRYGKWIPMGGHVELDEDPELALYREVAEETGLEVEVLSTKPQIESPGTKFLLSPHYVDVHEANPPHKHISFIYFARAKSPKFSLSNEHEAIKWFTETELEDQQYHLAPAIIFYAREALKTDRLWQPRKN
jgi:ADP-ribose pyrophosphatase YjhB (NUDIX family)